MEYTEFTPPAEVPAPAGPSKTDLIMQIEADHYSATQRGDDQEILDALEARHAAVSAAATNEAAREAYGL